MVCSFWDFKSGRSAVGWVCLRFTTFIFVIRILICVYWDKSFLISKVQKRMEGRALKESACIACKKLALSPKTWCLKCKADKMIDETVDQMFLFSFSSNAKVSLNFYPGTCREAGRRMPTTSVAGSVSTCLSTSATTSSRFLPLAGSGPLTNMETWFWVSLGWKPLPGKSPCSLRSHVVTVLTIMISIGMR